MSDSERAEIRVLAFDVALVTGWAFCQYLPSHPDYFEVLKTGLIDAHVHNEPSPLTEETYVRRLSRFGRMLDVEILDKLFYWLRMKETKPINIIAYEMAPWRAKKGTSGKVREMLLRLNGVLLEHLSFWVDFLGTEVLRVAPATWQKAIFGDKYKPREPSAIRKKLSMDHCRALGYNPKTDHEADAVNIAYFVAKGRLDEEVI